MRSNELSLYFHEVALNSTTWADVGHEACGCRGSGWWLSEVDTFHKCPFHAPDAPHPLDEDCEEDMSDAVFVEAPVVSVPSDDLPF
jgi:hypothetical protein